MLPLSVDRVLSASRQVPRILLLCVPQEAGSLPCESQAQRGVIYLLLSTQLWLLFQKLEPFTDGNSAHLWQGSPEPSTSSVPRNRASCRGQADMEPS